MIEIKYGKMEGQDLGDYMEYRKVPYAKPPIGELRFQKPSEPDSWEGVYQAVEYAPCCIQGKDRSTPPFGHDFYADPSYIRKADEDCLYLNIWTPKDSNPTEKYPVAFWIHGGAFLGGYATELEFDGAEYAKRSVILVSVEYRCNIFGFLAHPWLSAESPEGISGNYGIYDQLAALKWVRENISAFGGDPDNITVFGQSAGAMSAQTLVSSPLAKGMIAKAIFQSGGSYKIGLHNDIPLKTQESYGEVLTGLLGVSSLEELRALPAEAIWAAFPAWMGNVMAKTKGLFLSPTMDGQLLDDGYYKIIDDNRIMDIPYMVGWTKDDIDVMGSERAGQKEAKETMLAEGCKEFSLKLCELGRKGAYLYAFNRELPGDGWGAYHSAELFYMFGTLGRTWRPWTEADYALSERMLDCWTGFMKTGNPGRTEEVWPEYTKENPFVMEFDIE